MKIPHQPYRCPLGRLQPATVNAEEVKSRGWRDEHILVVREDDERLDFVEREFIRRIGERLYGSAKRGCHD